MSKNPETIFFHNVEKEEGEENVKTLKEFLRLTAEKLEKDGVPVRSNCRIEMDQFDKIYSIQEIEKDKKEISRIEFLVGAEESAPEKHLGEQLEMLKTGIFNKFLPDSFVTARASRFDDIKNGADNVIIDRLSGNIVCALDEVGEIQGARFEEKKSQVLRKNQKGGIFLKYALAAKDGQIIPSQAIQNIPIFYLALSREHVRKGIQEFVSSIDKPPSDYERKIFDYFISSIDTQIKAIELNLNLEKTLRKRVEGFKNTISQIRQKELAQQKTKN